MKCKSCGNRYNVCYWPKTAELICSLCWDMWMRATYYPKLSKPEYEGTR